MKHLYKARDGTAMKWLVSFSLVVFLAILFVSYGYAALNTKMSISGEAYVRVESDIRVTNLKLTSISSGGYETYNSKYFKDTTKVFVTLPANGSAIYEVEVTNKSTDEYFLKSLTSNVIYEIMDSKVYDIFPGKSTKKFRIKITNPESTSKNITFILVYQFQKDGMPTIALANLPAWNTKGDDYAVSPTYNAGPSGGSVSCKSNLNTNLANVTNLKNLTTTGVHNITCTVTSNTGKTASVTKSTKITYDPYVVKNMVTNNSFESSLTGWTGKGEISSTVYHSGKKSFYVNDVDTINGVWIYQTLNAPAGHKMFASVYSRYTKGTYGGTLGFTNNGADGVAAKLSKAYPNQWYYNSFVLTMPSKRTTFQIGSSIADTGTIYLDDILVFDLTAIFGAGLEPDINWCNKHVKYFSGTTTIYK